MRDGDEPRPGPIGRADDFQRRHPVVGFPLAVVYKFFDDQSNYLAATVTYYAFFAIFPLLLIASSVLGFLVQGDEELRRALLDSALGQFPIVGTKLGQPQGFQGSTSAVVIGGVLALYGVTNLGQAAVNALNAAWGIPRNTRLNPLHGRLRSIVLLVVGGFSVLVVALLPSLAGRLGLFAVGPNVVARGLVTVVSVALTAFVLAVMMRVASSVPQRLRTLLPGAGFVAVLWHALQEFGGLYVERVVTRVDEVNGIFAFVLGLIVLIYFGAVIAMLGIEIDVVLAERLYPRSLLTPFTDDVELTEADRRVYTRYAEAQRHKDFEQITVTFDREERDAGG